MNFEENHSLVVDSNDHPYAYDHTKKNWFDSSDEDEFDLHPISKDGYADFETIVRIKKKDLTPKFVRLTS